MIFKSIAKIFLILKSIKRKIFVALFKPLFKTSGKNVLFDPTNSSFSYSTIKLGSHIFIGGNAYWSASHSKIVIGDYVMFAPYSKIIGGDHATDDLETPMFTQKPETSKKVISKDIVIEDDVWIGAGVTILKGVRIAKGAIVGAGSVVVKNIHEYEIVAGNPAKKTGSRKE